MAHPIVRMAPSRMLRRTLPALAVACALAATAWGDAPIYHGRLRIDHAGRGRIDLNTGLASFRVKNWLFLPDGSSNGIDPGTQLVRIALGDTNNLVIPAGQMRVSKNGRRFTFTSKTNNGIQALKLLRLSDGSFRVKLLKVAGVDLSSLVISDPPVCLSFALIVGDDDGFSGVSFDRPKPYPSKLLTIPGFCTSNQGWPWIS